MSTERRKRTATRQEVGEYLRDFGDDFKLDGAARVDLDDDVVSVNPGRDVDFEVAVEDDRDGGTERRRVTFELSWEKTEYDEELAD